MKYKQFPISLSIPEYKITSEINDKTNLLSSFLPNEPSTHIYETEEDFYEQYRKSMFAYTNKKEGWDCLHHYEIIANCCIPFFIGLNECPTYTLTNFPKKLLYKARQVYRELHNVPLNEFEKYEKDYCYLLINDFLTYMKEHLTTTSIAKHILEKTEYYNIKTILFLPNNENPSPLCSLTLHGLKTLLGKKCHDYPKLEYAYSSDNDYSHYPNKGFTYTKIISQFMYDKSKNNTIMEDIENHKYDIIIYGNCRKTMNDDLYDVIKKYYLSEEIIFIISDEEPDYYYYNLLEKGHYVFIKEDI